MPNIPQKELDNLVGRVLAKHGWTQGQLAQEMGVLDPDKPVGDHTVSRWRRTGKIYQAHYDELLRLEKDDGTKLAPSWHQAGIPFSVTIPQNSLSFSLDVNGDIIVRGLLFPKKEDE